MGTASAVLYDEGSIESVYRPTDNRMRIESNKFSCSQQKPFHCSKKLIKVKSARVPAHQQGAAAGRWSAMLVVAGGNTQMWEIVQVWKEVRRVEG